MRRPPRGPQRRSNEPRTNNMIRRSPVRLIDADGEQVGVVTLDEAKQRARTRSLDLVEVSPNADPPVCKIMDWGKAKFERDKKAREAKKKTHVIEVKEVKFRPTIDDHDFGIKLDRARRFLSKGKKVKITVFFRYRQLRRPELGVQILDTISERISDIADIESRSRLEGRQMTMILSPKASAS
ncbi:MAG: translation initiation factor IF-3 [Acidobacteriota bacterium]